ncbi:MAG: hypothetical protein QXP97_07605 [Desulfurococcus sp.]|uniref:hypothetical protein n=1 Tax=Desulfurococcus sp. TaxID=51678 RepID=UPI0031614455
MASAKEVRETLALRHIREFARHARDLIEGIKAEHLIEEGGLNPYMVAALGIGSIEDAVELFVYRRVERSLGTSFGNVIEAFLRELLGGKRGRDMDPRCRARSGRKPWICWWDVVVLGEVEKGGKKYRGIVLSVKSGPADLNKDIIEMFIQHAKEAEREGYRPYLVLTYGKKAFTVAETTLKSWGLDPKEYLLVGRDIFREFLGSPGYYDRVIDLMRSVGEEVDIFKLIEGKVRELSEDLKRRYGDDVTKLLKDLS